MVRLSDGFQDGSGTISFEEFANGLLEIRLRRNAYSQEEVRAVSMCSICIRHVQVCVRATHMCPGKVEAENQAIIDVAYLAARHSWDRHWQTQSSTHTRTYIIICVYIYIYPYIHAICICSIYIYIVWICYEFVSFRSWTMLDDVAWCQTILSDVKWCWTPLPSGCPGCIQPSRSWCNRTCPLL